MSASLRLFLRRGGAFLTMRATEHLSYRVASGLEFISVLVTVAMTYFLGVLVDASGTPLLRDYQHVGYFGFALTGTALAGYLGLSLNSIAKQVRQWQLQGNLEALFLAPMPSWQIVIFGAIWSFAFETIKLLVFLAGGLALGLPLGQADWGAGLVVLLATILALLPLGVFGAAFVIVWQRGDPVSYFVTIASTLLAGIYYPISVLPEWLQLASKVLPLTYAVEAFRGALLRGNSVRQLFDPLLALLVFAAVLGPASVWVFNRSVEVARRRGSLGSY